MISSKEVVMAGISHNFFQKKKMIGDVKMQTIKRRTGRSLTGDRPLFLALHLYTLMRVRDNCKLGGGKLPRQCKHQILTTYTY